ncbi:hypothetical protein E5288_WYG017195 [Bos mutus]|uniref:Uncharacterized protein n=1 Tax=Bos mutus TaxID=72004 RepID=A0A6B0RJW4_9CETA|nr:hypothetical protein [Bos mutus]
MFKCSRRRYRQKRQGPAGTTVTTNLASVATDINDTQTATTRVLILAPQDHAVGVLHPTGPKPVSKIALGLFPGSVLLRTDRIVNVNTFRPKR